MEEIKALLKRYGIRPSKGLGQNFLLDGKVLDRIVDAAELSEDDLVLEVGPGLGMLTRRLADEAGQVFAVELDRKMLPILEEQLATRTNVHVLNADILEIDPLYEVKRYLGREIATSAHYKVVANLPYYITSAVLRHFLNQRVSPELLILMVQYEVAQRIIAEPGDMSLLALSIQIYGSAQVITKVPASAFLPRPKVDSAVIRIAAHATPRVPLDQVDELFRIAKAAFMQKRKQLHNSLGNNLHLESEEVLAALDQANIAPTRRPQTLSVEEWLALTRALADASHSGQGAG